jgi:secreted trypsin-like serine protease
MRKALIVALAVSGVLATTAGAITTNGFPDNGRHPNVGAILVPARSGVGYAEVCSGTLVSPTLFMTASHCTAFLDSDRRPEFVTFDETMVEDNPTGLIEVMEVHTNTSYKRGYRDDVSLLEFETPVTGITPAKLPPLGYLDTVGLSQDTKMTVVGYGTREQEVVKGEGPTFPFEGSREYAIGSFNALTPQWLKMSQNQAHGDGGAGYGDSGGPTFLGSGADESDIVVAVTSTGDIPCYSTNVSGRTDSPSARAFLKEHGL